MCICSRKRPLRLFEVLARNRQSAVGLLGGTKSAREQPPRVSTIPPRQQLSITIWLAIRKRRVTRRDRIRIRIKRNVITERERGREREKKRYKTSGSAKVPSPGVTETKPSTERERNIQQRARFARNLLKNTQKHTHTQSIIVTQTKHTRTRDLQTRVSPYSYIP